VPFDLGCQLGARQRAQVDAAVNEEGLKTLPERQDAPFALVLEIDLQPTYVSADSSHDLVARGAGTPVERAGQ